MAVSRAERRAARAPAVQAVFAGDAPAVLDLLELLELAWHDCYGEISPPDEVVADVLLCSGGDLATLVSATRLAVADWRDLRVWADDLRASDP